MNKVKLLMLSSGQIVIGKVADEPHFWVVSKPHTVMASPQGMGLTTWPPFSDDKVVSIAKEHVVVIADAEPQIEAAYTKVTSGLIMPQGGNLVS